MSLQGSMMNMNLLGSMGNLDDSGLSFYSSRVSFPDLRVNLKAPG
jgi:hypothetical protein